MSRVRNEKGWSQETLTAKCQLAGWDISRGIIVSIEGGFRKVEDWQILILARVLNVHPGQMFPASFEMEDLPMPSEETQRVRREVMDSVRWNKAKEAENEKMWDNFVIRANAGLPKEENEKKSKKGIIGLFLKKKDDASGSTLS